MTISDIIKKFTHKDDEYKQAEKELKINKTLETRQKNSNERELDKYHEEDRQEQIKKELEYYRKKKKDELWHGKSLLAGKNIFKGHKSILSQDKNILTNNKKLLKSENIFAHGGWGW
jgi:homoserine dehydrogenase